MRETYHNKRVLVGDDGQFIGIALGADFCAEHEWGIGKIDRFLGMSSLNENNPGHERRILRNADLLVYESDNKFDYIGFSRYLTGPDHKLSVLMGRMGLKHLKTVQAEEGFHAAWDESSFGIAIDRKKYPNLAKDFKQAADNGTLIVYVGSGGPFSNGGLVFLDISQSGQEFLDQFKNTDLEILALQKAKKDTGIEEILQAAGKRYFALSPRFDTDGGLKFWLNPMDQDRYNYGWFTVDELKAWAKNEGPIMMVAEKK